MFMVKLVGKYTVRPMDPSWDMMFFKLCDAELEVIVMINRRRTIVKIRKKTGRIPLFDVRVSPLQKTTSKKTYQSYCHFRPFFMRFLGGFQINYQDV